MISVQDLLYLTTLSAEQKATIVLVATILIVDILLCQVVSITPTLASQCQL